MLEYIGKFNIEIASKYREVNVKMGFIKNGKAYWLESEAIQKHTYRAEGATEIGCVVRKVLDMTLMVNDVTRLLAEGDSVNLFYTTPSGECKVDIFFVNRVKVNDKNMVTEIEALDYLSYTKDNPMPFISMAKHTNLVTYADRLCESLGMDLIVKGDIVNPNLKLAYPKSYLLQDVLDEMAGAMNATLTTKTNGTYGARFPLKLPFKFNQAIITENVFMEAKPYKASNPIGTLDFTNGLLEVTIDDDSTSKYERVSISVFNPSSSRSKDLGNISKQVPAMTKNVDLGVCEFKEACLPQVIHFDKEVEVVDFNISVDKAAIKINTKDILNDDLVVEFQGLNFNEVSNFEESESKTKIVENIYIQSPNIYDTRIFKGKNIRVKYTGNPLWEIGDTLNVAGMAMLVTEHELTYTGGLRGSMKGVVIDG